MSTVLPMLTMRLSFNDFPSVERFVHVSRCLPIISELTHTQAAHWVLDSRSTRKPIMQRLRILLTEPTFLSAGLARNKIFTTPARFPVSVPRRRRSFLYFPSVRRIERERLQGFRRGACERCGQRPLILGKPVANRK